MKQQNQTFRFQINEKLNESNAQAILHKFIQSFLQELNIESHNFFYSTELETDDYTASEPPKFLYIFTVPENDYFNCIVQGKPYTDKTQAKQSCCYNACEWLYKHGIIEKMLKETNSDVNLLQSHLNDFNLNNDANKDNTDSPVSETNTAQQMYLHFCFYGLLINDLFFRNEVRKKSTQSKWFTHIQNRREAHSNKHYLYVFTFQSDYDFFVGNKHQHLGLITTEPFPNPIIDSMIYRNEQLIKFTIKNVFCEPINDHQKKLIKLFHYHIMEHFIPKLFNSKEKNDYLSSYLNFPDLTLYFVLVNLHNATTFSIDFGKVLLISFKTFNKTIILQIFLRNYAHGRIKLTNTTKLAHSHFKMVTLTNKLVNSFRHKHLYSHFTRKSSPCTLFLRKNNQLKFTQKKVHALPKKGEV